MAYGLLSTGFVPKTFDVIYAEIEADLKLALGLSVVTGALAKVAAIFAERETRLWELAEAIYHSQDPTGATGDALDAVCEITGTLRKLATRSLVDLYLTGTAATSITDGSRVATLSTAAEFETLTTALLALATAWAISTAYVVGDVRSNATRIYICTTAGTSAGAGGPTTTAGAITDNTVVWRYIGEGLAFASVSAQAVLTGPTVAVASDVTSIVTPVGGWSSVRNLLDAVEGTNIESDADLRERRAEEVDSTGNGPPEAIKQDLSALAGVTFVQIFYNDTDVTDADGIPPHSTEPLVIGGVNQDIWDQLRLSIGSGLGTHGTEVGTSTDSEGVAHTFRFSRPDEEPIYIDLEIQYVAAKVAVDWETQVKLAIATAGDDYETGMDVVASAVSALAHTIRGVKKVTVCDIGLAANPAASADLVMTSRQLATFDTSRITIVGTPVTA